MPLVNLGTIFNPKPAAFSPVGKGKFFTSHLGEQLQDHLLKSAVTQLKFNIAPKK